ncbi:MBL fold metallo-hydrolase [Desulfosudis oleivorans]|uniref:Beta-lactamase domain protein n=1 Tax=Desulfosudis oleivorans (strain DSM 6200 / JCM 39069 / Hxd3) TaxID=96561 RepID=A8ZWM9_DESOH|nr:MBL fold metallo-hydrolase [Desulfosudis oleivorans]ABW68360.1 beta-lactamase domain protein [Desulfosudis oleivorans Hxd3]
MIEEIVPDLFRVKIPLPDTPLKYLNSYVIRAEPRSLIVDTGLNHDVCFEAMQAGLAEIGLDMSKADLFITHMHADHFGLVTRMATDSTQVFFNRLDAEIIENWQGFEPMIQYAVKSGLPEGALRKALDRHPARKFGTDWRPPLQILSDGHQVNAGRYRFTCVHTPGHTQGHMCLYEPAHKILIAGDHLLIDITPNIQCWSEDDDPLNSYMASLDKVRAMDIARVLPGHRRLFDDCHRRVDELKTHHEHRLEEVMEILVAQPGLSAFETASFMTWDIAAENWDAFPPAQKWFATGEAISHLRYLENKNRIFRKTEDPVITYAVK